MAEKELTTKAIAERINAHLKRFERDPEINTVNKAEGQMRTSRFFDVAAVNSGRFVNVVYISYQGSSTLNRADALKYLEWLDAGNVGRHYEALKG